MRLVRACNSLLLRSAGSASPASGEPARSGSRHGTISCSAVTVRHGGATTCLMRRCCILFALGMAACDQSAIAKDDVEPVANLIGAASADRVAPAASAELPKAVVVDTTKYPWHRDASIKPLPPVDTLRQRFAPPDGFTRVAVGDDSFGAWLRAMPLAKSGSPVLAYDGRVLLRPGHENVAAVTTLDIGKRDLQQCADAIMRLHAEWLWSRGEQSRASYPSGGGPISWTRYRQGAIPRADGHKLVWHTRGGQPDNHASYRKYLDIVFSWANTGSLALRTHKPKREEVRPGDFFVLAGSPGHAVLLLDIATHADGRKVALIGQSFMPAQTFQVLRPSRDVTWFELTDDGARTPFWVPFGWKSLRRLDRES